MDEVFGDGNFVSVITVRKTTSEGSSLIGATCDYLLWFAKNVDRTKFRPMYVARSDNAEDRYNQLLLSDGAVRAATEEERTGQAVLPDGAALFRLDNITSSRPTGDGDLRAFALAGKTYSPGNGTFKTNLEGMNRLSAAGRLQASGKGKLNYRRLATDFSVAQVANLWADISGAVQSRSDPKVYVVQTSGSVIQRAMLMTTDPGDLVLDPTCGSGTSAYVAEQWGRRWITIDTSRVPLALARQRLLTATFPFHELKDPARGPAGGFKYVRKQNNKGEEVGGIVPHITLKSIANNEPPDYEVLVDRPELQKGITRVTGRFVFEATIPTSQSMDDPANPNPLTAGEAADRDDWTARMIGILRASPVLHIGAGRTVKFASVREPAQALTLSAEAMALNESLNDELTATGIANGELPLVGGDAGGKPIAILFGPENGALTESTVRQAHDEASMRSRGYAHLYVIGFAIDPRAREYLEHAAKLGLPATYVQATPDVLMGDLLKNMRSSQIFSVCGLPDIEVKRVPPPEDAAPGAKGLPYFEVALNGLDVFDPASQEVDHRSGDDVPCWLLDTDYNGMVFHVNQAFFPRTAAWDNLKRSLKAEFDDSVWAHLSGSSSAPFTLGRHGKIAVKVIDDRGNELMVVREMSEVKQ